MSNATETKVKDEVAVVAPETQLPGTVQVGAGALIFDDTKFERMQAIAKMMASGKCAIPKHLQNNPSDCFAVIMQAAQWGMNPFAVAQKTHVVNGTLGYEAQLVNAVINSMHVIKDRFHYQYVGNWDAYRASGYKQSAEAGCGVNVGATLRGEDEIRWLPAPLCMESVKVRNSPLWATNPQQQIAYLAVKHWARLYAPDAVLGVYSDDELSSTEPINITPAAEQKPAPAKKTATQRLKEKLGAANAVDVEITEVKEEKPNTPAISELISKQIETVGAPIALEDVQNFLKAKKVLKGNMSIDDLGAYCNDEWRDYVTKNIPDLVDKAAQWATQESVVVEN